MTKVNENYWMKKTIEQNTLSRRDYQYGFYTDIEMERIPKGLKWGYHPFDRWKKGEPEWMFTRRLKAYRHWKTMKEPHWPNFQYGPIDYQASSYYTAPPKARG